MAGGGGTRLWPLSRQKMPKQFLNLSGKDLLINETIDRLSQDINKGNIFIVTGQDYLTTVIEKTNNRIVPKHILSEPAARGTLACIGFAAISIYTECGDGIIVAAPSDAYIKDTVSFSNTLSEAMAAAEQEDKLITIGISPTFAATGYGYIKYCQTNTSAKPVERFTEKPEISTAEQYIKENYLWNSGIFISKISVLLDLIESYATDVYQNLKKLGTAYVSNDFDTINSIYPLIRKISFDYAIAEPASIEKKIMVVPGDFGWSDVGTWDMLNTIHPTDKNDNVIIGDTMVIDSTNCVIISDKKLIAAVGVDNIVIVDTGDALLICNKDKAQDIGSIQKRLKESGRNDLI